MIFYIIGSLYRIQVDESNLPVAFLKVAPGAVFLRQFSVLGLHLASNSLWFDPDLWTCFGLAFRENSLSHLKCAINHPTGYNRPSQMFFEHGSVHDNDNDNQCLKKTESQKNWFELLKTQYMGVSKNMGFSPNHPFKKRRFRYKPTNPFWCHIAKMVRPRSVHGWVVW